MKNSDIANLRLRNQGLSELIFKDPIDAVRQLGAVQAQDYAGAKWALGQRLVGYTNAVIDKAFNEGKILRTHILRPAWHFVTPADIHWMLLISAPRVHAVSSYYYRKAGLDSAMAKRTNTVITKALRGGNQLMRTEIASALEKAGISTSGELQMNYILIHAELDGVICSGARRGKQFTYALLQERAPQVRTWKQKEAIAELVKRYFKTRGPATLHDFTWWSGLTMADSKSAMEMVKSEFASENINGQTYWFPESNVLQGEKTPTAYLLPNYDEYFIGFKDRSAIGEAAGTVNLPANDPTLIANVIVLNGQVVGGWKRTLKKDTVSIELKLLIKLTRNEKKAIELGAERFGGFLGLTPAIIWK
jgi:hypothetical protein